MRLLNELNEVIRAADAGRLRQIRQSLKGKIEILCKMDEEILALVGDDRVETEIEQADIVKEEAELGVIRIEEALASFSETSEPKNQPAHREPSSPSPSSGEETDVVSRPFPSVSPLKESLPTTIASDHSALTDPTRTPTQVSGELVCSTPIMNGNVTTTSKPVTQVCATSVYSSCVMTSQPVSFTPTMSTQGVTMLEPPHVVSVLSSGAVTSEPVVSFHAAPVMSVSDSVTAPQPVFSVGDTPMMNMYYMAPGTVMPAYTTPLRSTCTSGVAQPQLPQLYNPYNVPPMNAPCLASNTLARAMPSETVAPKGPPPLIPVTLHMTSQPSYIDSWGASYHTSPSLMTTTNLSPQVGLGASVVDVHKTTPLVTPKVGVEHTHRVRFRGPGLIDHSEPTRARPSPSPDIHKVNPFASSSASKAPPDNQPPSFMPLAGHPPFNETVLSAPAHATMLSVPAHTSIGAGQMPMMPVPDHSTMYHGICPSPYATSSWSRPNADDACARSLYHGICPSPYAASSWSRPNADDACARSLYHGICPSPYAASSWSRPNADDACARSLYHGICPSPYATSSWSRPNADDACARSLYHGICPSPYATSSWSRPNADDACARSLYHGICPSRDVTSSWSCPNAHDTRGSPSKHDAICVTPGHSHPFACGLCTS